MNTSIDTNARPQWWHKLNAASPEIANRALINYLAKSPTFLFQKTITVSEAFVWGTAPEGHDFWNEVHEFLEERSTILPPSPCGAPSQAQEPTPYQLLEAQLVASQAREKLLRDQVFDLLHRVRTMEADHGLPTSPFSPVE